MRRGIPVENLDSPPPQIYLEFFSFFFFSFLYIHLFWQGMDLLHTGENSFIWEGQTSELSNVFPPVQSSYTDM